MDRADAAAETLITRVRDLGPLVRAHSTTFDRERRLPAPVFAALGEAGLFRLFLPAALGGPELSPLGFMRVVEAAAELDGSVGWLVGNGGGMSRAAGYLAAEVAGPWFQDPDAFVAAATGALGRAAPVAGGYRVSGRWPFGSGIHHATVAMGLCGVADGADATAPAPTIACYMPRAAVTVHDNWFVSGLRGTGSCDFEAADVFVPAENTHAFPDIAPTQPGTIYRMPAVSAFAITVATVPLGIARAAIAAFAEAAARARPGTAAPREREAVQIEAGRAEARHAAARLYLAQSIADVAEATDGGGETLARARVALRMACATAAETAVTITDALAAASGSAALFEGHPLDRCARDARAAARHVAMSPAAYQIGGRFALGMELAGFRL